MNESTPGHEPRLDYLRVCEDWVVRDSMHVEGSAELLPKLNLRV